MFEVEKERKREKKKERERDWGVTDSRVPIV
jgi:hypothetical protein